MKDCYYLYVDDIDNFWNLVKFVNIYEWWNYIDLWEDHRAKKLVDTRKVIIYKGIEYAIDMFLVD